MVINDCYNASPISMKCTIVQKTVSDENKAVSQRGSMSWETITVLHLKLAIPERKEIEVQIAMAKSHQIYAMVMLKARISGPDD